MKITLIIIKQICKEEKSVVNFNKGSWIISFSGELCIYFILFGILQLELDTLSSEVILFSF